MVCRNGIEQVELKEKRDSGRMNEKGKGRTKQLRENDVRFSPGRQ